MIIDDVSVDSPTLGRSWRVLVQRPTSADNRPLPWLWLLHGSTATADEMRPVLLAAADAMAAGDVPQMIIAAPDAPEGYRSSWWVDSAYAPSGDEPAPVNDHVPRRGRLLESALLGDVLSAIEARYGPPTSAANRTVGGISMGGAAALRWLLVRPDLFGSCVLLSPAVYERAPADGSSARFTGAFGVDDDLYDAERYRTLMHYPTLLAVRDPSPTATSVVIITGDEEPVQLCDGHRCDLDLEAVRLHTTLKARSDFDPRLRVISGGHDWPVWESNIGYALSLLAPRTTSSLVRSEA